QLWPALASSGQLAPRPAAPASSSGQPRPAARGSRPPPSKKGFEIFAGRPAFDFGAEILWAGATHLSPPLKSCPACPLNQSKCLSRLSVWFFPAQQFHAQNQQPAQRLAPSAQTLVVLCSYGIAVEQFEHLKRRYLVQR